MTPSLAQRVDWTGGFRCATDQAVLKAIARWFCYRADGTCRPFHVSQLAVKAGVPKRSADRALARLAEDWRIEVLERIPGSRQATRYRIVVERLATDDPDAIGVTPSSATVARDRDVRAPQWRAKWRATTENRPKSEQVARDVQEEAAEEEVRTASPPSTEARHSGARSLHRDVATFLDWCRVTYPAHAKGASFVIDDRDAYVAHTLLERYALERLQAMAIVCWTTEADADPESHASWIAHKSDRRLRVIRHKAAFLERVVVGAQQLTLPALVQLTAQEIAEAKEIYRRAYTHCPHDPAHEDWRDCVRAIALKRHVG